MLIFDAHLDLAMNAVEWNRDLTRSIGEIRQHEGPLKDKPDRGRGTVCFPEMRKGGVGLCVATQIARIEHNAYSPVFGWRSPAQAWAMTQAQLAWYRAMNEAGETVPIKNRSDLEGHLKLWEEFLARATWSDTSFWFRAAAAHDGADAIESGKEIKAGGMQPPPIGYVLSLEGADSLITLQHLERSVEAGLRAVGPAHYGPGVYANGTDATGGFNSRGRELLQEMGRLGLILDATHLCDECFWEALDLFSGPIWASHSNCRSLVPHNRQLSDEQIRALIQRGAVIGAALDAWMLLPGWIRGKTTPEATGLMLEKFVEQLDHVCQLAGNADHCGIGSDLDGAFGREQTPKDLESIADLARIPGMLRARGFLEADVGNIASGNFVRFLRGALP